MISYLFSCWQPILTPQFGLRPHWWSQARVLKSKSSCCIIQAVYGMLGSILRWISSQWTYLPCFLHFCEIQSRCFLCVEYTGESLLLYIIKNVNWDHSYDLVYMTTVFYGPETNGAPERLSEMPLVLQPGKLTVYSLHLFPSCMAVVVSPILMHEKKKNGELQSCVYCRVFLVLQQLVHPIIWKRSKVMWTKQTKIRLKAKQEENVKVQNTGKLTT